MHKFIKLTNGHTTMLYIKLLDVPFHSFCKTSQVSFSAPSMGLISYQINDNCASAVLPHPAALRFYHKHSDPCNEDAPGSMGVVLFLEIVDFQYVSYSHHRAGKWSDSGVFIFRTASQ